MGRWVTWVGLFTNAHTLADSPSGACQYPTILWYDTVDNCVLTKDDPRALTKDDGQYPTILWYYTVDNQTVLQSDSEHVSRCYCLRTY